MRTLSWPKPCTTFAMPRARRVCGGYVRWLLPALLVIFGGWLAMPQTTHAQTIITVDVDAPGPLLDGLSWTTAYTTVQDALDLTNANGGVNYESGWRRASTTRTKVAATATTR